MDRLVPHEVGTDELLVRGILHPFFYSNSEKKIKREAFLPPPNKNDVSLLRYDYTTDNFCKKHAQSLKIKDNKYCGLATFIHNHIFEINNKIEVEITAELKASPIDNNGLYRKDLNVFTNDPGLPMHADLLYETPTIKGEPNTKHRKYAQLLCKKSFFLKDPNPEDEGWMNEKICWKNS